MTRYREICADLAERIGSGEFAAGAALPAVRELAAEWDTTTSTVSRAARVLAEAGVIVLADRRRAHVARDGALAARRFLHGDLVLRLAGSDDPALDLVLRHLGHRVVTFAAGGSSAGLMAVRQGRADAAATHLLHLDGGYNAPFARGLLRGLHPHLLHLWRREQGLLVAPGNPLGLGDVVDLTRVRVAKRAHGTGTRVLLDRLLRDAGADPDSVQGPEVGSHLEVALAVATGVVDTGVGVRAAAGDLGLSFVPLTWEDYDIVLGAAALDAAAALIATLRRDDVRAEVAGLGGYDPADSGTVTDLEPLPCPV
ncbi:MAG: GntR family transcriptional regulator [Pseudonocardia sp.]|nr:GntR family transcriptional regulator [Pseudonocardia sp.]